VRDLQATRLTPPPPTHTQHPRAPVIAVLVEA
jgi:hypothetical protein